MTIKERRDLGHAMYWVRHVRDVFNDEAFDGVGEIEESRKLLREALSVTRDIGYDSKLSKVAVKESVHLEEALEDIRKEYARNPTRQAEVAMELVEKARREIRRLCRDEEVEAYKKLEAEIAAGPGWSYMV